MPTPENESQPRRRPKRQVDLGPTGETVRRNIQKARKAQGLTHADLVERMRSRDYSVPRTAMSEIENGGRRVSVDDLMALAAALDVPPNALLFPLEDDAEGVKATGVGGISLQELWSWADGGKSLEDIRHPLRPRLYLDRGEEVRRRAAMRPQRSREESDAMVDEALERLRKATRTLEQLQQMKGQGEARGDDSEL